MPIEIRELIIKATIDKKPFSNNDKSVLNNLEKENLKKEILAYCIQNIEKPFNKKIGNPINR